MIRLVFVATVGVTFGFFTSNVWAAGGPKDFEAAMALRRAVEVKDSQVTIGSSNDTEKYELPVTRGFHQKDSQLCWAYATLNALETWNLVQRADVPVELSRGYMQHTTWQDRLERRMSAPNSQLSDRGTAMNAIFLAQEKGLAQFNEYVDISNDPDIAEILEKTQNSTGLNEKFQIIASELEQHYGKLPQTSTIAGTKLSTHELGKLLVGTKPWTSYAVARNGQPLGWGSDPDPDGRGDYQVKFVTLDEIKSKIRESLKAGVPVMYSNLAHLTLIYGATYDANGEAVVFYVKDSYPNYFYTADANAMYSRLLEITTNL